MKTRRGMTRDGLVAECGRLLKSLGWYFQDVKDRMASWGCAAPGAWDHIDIDTLHRLMRWLTLQAETRDQQEGA